MSNGFALMVWLLCVVLLSVGNRAVSSNSPAPAPSGQQGDALAQAGKILASKGCKSFAFLGRAQEVLCTEPTGYQACREYLKTGLMRKCLGDFWKDSSRVKSTGIINPAQLKIFYTSDAQIRVAFNRRGWGVAEGESGFTAYFPVPQRPPLTPAECSPACISAGPAGCHRSCAKKDQFLMRTTGPAGGLWALTASAACNDPVRATYKPDEDDMLMAYDQCEEQKAWGKNITLNMQVIAGAIFHMNNARTTNVTVLSCDYVNAAELLKSTTNLQLKVSVMCQAQAK